MVYQWVSNAAQGRGIHELSIAAREIEALLECAIKENSESVNKKHNQAKEKFRFVE